MAHGFVTAKGDDGEIYSINVNLARLIRHSKTEGESVVIFDDGHAIAVKDSASSLLILASYPHQSKRSQEILAPCLNSPGEQLCGDLHVHASSN
jgi:hypothetical protein